MKTTTDAATSPIDQRGTNRPSGNVEARSGNPMNHSAAARSATTPFGGPGATRPSAKPTRSMTAAAGESHARRPRRTDVMRATSAPPMAAVPMTIRLATSSDSSM